MIKVKDFLDQTIYYGNHRKRVPLISIIFFVSARSELTETRRALSTVLHQTFKEYEIILIDDGPTSDVYKLLRSVTEENNKIYYIHNEKACGIPAIRLNQALKVCRGTYIAYQFANGEWLANTLDILYRGTDNQKYDFVFGKTSLDSTNGNFVLVGNAGDDCHLRNSPTLFLSGMIHKRSLIDEIGIFTCHLSLRKTYAWEFLIRLREVTNTRSVPDLISVCRNVYISYVITPVERYCLRVYTELGEKGAQSFEGMEEYAIEDLSFFQNKLEVYNGAMADWFLAYRFDYDVGPMRLPREKKEILLVTKQSLASSVDITVFNFTHLLAEDYAAMYVPENQLTDDIVKQCDFLLLHRTCYPISTNVLRRLKGIKPVLYLIDDDLLNVHKLDPIFSYLAPGTIDYTNLTAQLQGADIVLTYSNDITASVKPHNNRTLQLKTNILSTYLEKEVQRKQEDEPFKIAYIGGTARKEEIAFFWGDLVKLSQQYKSKVSFYFWGLTPENLGDLTESDVQVVGYSSSYYEYLKRLVGKEFDVVLAPLFESPAKIAKSPIKLLEACVCNAVGIFSEGIPYGQIEHGITGMKIKNEQNQLFQAIDYLISNSEKRIEIVSNAKKYVRENYTTELQVNEFRSALEAGKLHGYVDKGVICYCLHSAYLGGAEHHLFRHAMLGKKYGFQIIVTLPIRYEPYLLKMKQLCVENDIEVVYVDYIHYMNPYLIDVNRTQAECVAIKEILTKYNVKLIHTTTFIPGVHLAARELNIGVVTSLYGSKVTTNEANLAVKEVNIPIGVTENSLPSEKYLPSYVHTDSFYFANYWRETLGATTICLRSPLEEKYFTAKKNNEISFVHGIKCVMVGTVQPSKGQDCVLTMIGKLNKQGYNISLSIYGYDHFIPEYKEQCTRIISEYGIEDKVVFKGFCDEIASELQQMDVFICGSYIESFPQAILEAMAMRLIILTTPVAGVPELIIDGVSGYVAEGYSEGALREKMLQLIQDVESYSEKVEGIRDKAFQIVRRDCNNDLVAADLFGFYNRVIVGGKVTYE